MSLAGVSFSDFQTQGILQRVMRPHAVLHSWRTDKVRYDNNNYPTRRTTCFIMLPPEQLSQENKEKYHVTMQRVVVTTT